MRRMSKGRSARSGPLAVEVVERSSSPDIESARRQATDVLLEQRLFVLDSDRYDAFLYTLDHPPAPGLKLRSLLRRVPRWRK
ncbi:MAG: DUF1778 domain-containing protein [Hyphomicrobiales bacterium]|nr:DUF1778 domain-containing protein [Hyphomicrobiales bacterium]